MYIPKSRIKTGLYTQDGEYVIYGTTIPYTGYYYELYNGQYYSGQTPDSENSVRLELAPPPQQEVSTGNIDEVVVNTQTDNVDPVGGYTSTGDVGTYLSLTGGQLETKLLPSPITVNLTEEDYTNGQFIRYFAKKTNEYKYIEISEDTYIKLKNRSADYLWQHYLLLNMPWMIAGSKDQVYTTNKNITALTEQTYNIQGLQQYLKEDYLKFYKES